MQPNKIKAAHKIFLIKISFLIDVIGTTLSYTPHQIESGKTFPVKNKKLLIDYGLRSELLFLASR
jgi:hypothetical protein